MGIVRGYFLIHWIAQAYNMYLQMAIHCMNYYFTSCNDTLLQAQRFTHSFCVPGYSSQCNSGSSSIPVLIVRVTCYLYLSRYVCYVAFCV